MIDFRDCPYDLMWLLESPEGERKELHTEAELLYARLQIMKNKLSGYVLIRPSNGERFPIGKNGGIDNWPMDLFCTAERLSAEILRLRYNIDNRYEEV